MSRRVIIDELEFEVPYGKLSAKTWHEETDECKRVLVLHGWMDNAGSFDNLIPKLKYKDGLYVVGLDLPGHGKSSQLPPGSSYSDMHIVMEIRRCLTELKWIQPIKRVYNGESAPGGFTEHTTEENDTININEPGTAVKKFSIIGHSLGAGLGLFYASLYPNDVDEVIIMDFIKAKSPSIHALLRSTAETIDKYIEIVPSRSPFSSPTIRSLSTSNREKAADKGQVVVSHEAAIIATVEAHRQLGNLSREDAICLIKRSTVAVSSPPNSVLYSRDLRLQAMLNMRENLDYMKAMFANVKCDLIFVLAKNGMYASDELFRDKMDEMEEYYRARAKSMHLQWMEGDHYLHLSRSKETAEIINKYLESPEQYKVIQA